MRRRIDDEEPLISSSETDTNQKSTSTVIPARYSFALLGCFGFINAYCMRVNLSVAMVAMVNSTSHAKAPNVTTDCGHSDDGKIHSLEQNGEFDWDERTQGIILGSFYWGYLLTQIPGGRLSEIFSGKWLFGGGILATAVFTLLTPVAARWGVGYLIAVRVFEGLGEGVTFPAMQYMISHWAPLNERSRFVAVIFAGCLLGTVIGLPISSYLCVHGFADGWPSVFYVFGIIGILWFILWIVFSYENPDCHPWISKEEKLYIQKGIATYDEEKLPFPWKEILKSPPVWAITAAFIGNNWGFYTLLTELPTYLKTVLHFDMQSNGLYSALPYFFSWLVSLIACSICDKVVEKNYIRLTIARKICNSIGLLVPAALLVGLSYVGCDSSTIYVMLSIAMAINGFTYAGYNCSHIDIAPNFAGTLMGITNSAATITGMIAPIVVGALIEDNPSRSQWAIVFYISAAIYVFGAVSFLMFGTAEEQYWNKLKTGQK